ncbi:MAG TPA: radical SAM protein [Cytophagales bacterium]|nr:radical SAM protein [Cytophagales bacterium]
MLSLDFYKLLKIHQMIKSPKLKLFGVYVANLLGMRHYSVRIDPALHCNLECRMCYFSDPDWKKRYKGLLSVDEMKGIAKMLFPRALQVVVGCGAEPTIHKSFMTLIEEANKYGVPNVSMVTNGLLLTEEQLERLAQLKLKELIISLHGVNKDTYEKMMTKGEHGKFIELMEMLKRLRAKYDYPKVRINYTVNKENLEELRDFFKVYGSYPIDVIQLRPVMDIGGVYSESISELQKDAYNEIISAFKSQSTSRDIKFLVNAKDVEYKEDNSNSDLISALYWYISPRIAEQLKLSWTSNDYKDYLKATQWRKSVRNSIFSFTKSQKSTDKFLKYEWV